MRRILIVGNIASGKSTLARELGIKLALPVYHLDRHFWGADWTMPEKDGWNAWVDDVTTQSTWIIDGNYRSSLLRRAAQADTVVFIDIHWVVALFKYTVRSIRQSRKGHDDIPVAAVDSVQRRNLRAILRFSRDILPTILLACDLVPTVLIFRSTDEAMQWAHALPPNAPS